MSNEYIDATTGEVVRLGLVEMTNDEYHAGPGISKSHLDVIAGKSPLHYWAKYIDPNRVREEPTAAMKLGTAIHAAVLEPDLLHKTCVADPGIDKRSNAGKAEWAAFKAEHAGKLILPDDDFQACLQVRDAVLRHPVARGLLSGGKAEQSFFAIDSETGELVKCRTDYLQDSGALVVDVKSTDDASPTGFAKSVANFRYHIQPPWYFDVLKTAFGEAPANWVFLAVEKKPPYAIGAYFVHPTDVERAREVARRDLARIVECKRAGSFPDFAAEVLPLELPRWTAW